LLVVPGSAFTVVPERGFDPECQVVDVVFAVNGSEAPLVALRRGDEVEVRFTVPVGCTNRMNLVSFVAPDPAFDGSRLARQAVFERDVGLLGPGRHSLKVAVPVFSGRDAHDCTAVPSVESDELRAHVRELMDRYPAYREQVRRELREKASVERSSAGARSCEVAGVSTQRRPCNGCVGNADDKEPHGDEPDDDAGHECDRNHGIGKGNPAHSGCENFQVDFSYRPSHSDADAVRGHGKQLIAGVFCIGATSMCYFTDNTGTDAVLGGSDG
jgi:hypothetical protein